MGIMSPKVQENVLKCVRDASVAVPVRLAAIDAFRSSPCSSDLNNIFLTIMENERDNEIPIAAYLAVMRCPTATEDTLVRVTDYLGHWSRGPHCNYHSLYILVCHLIELFYVMVVNNYAVKSQLLNRKTIVFIN